MALLANSSAGTFSFKSTGSLCDFLILLAQKYRETTMATLEALMSEQQLQMFIFKLKLASFFLIKI